MTETDQRTVTDWQRSILSRVHDPREFQAKSETLKSREYQIIHDKNADPMDVASELDWTCPYCGEILPPTHWQEIPWGVGLGHWVRNYNHGCPPERAQMAQQRAAQVARQRSNDAARWDSLLNHCGITAGKIRTWTFDSYIARDDWPASHDIKNACRQYIDGLLNDTLTGPNWLILVGAYGTGKSHLGASIVRAALERGRRGYFRVWPNYLARIRATFDRRNDPHAEREADIVAELQRGWLVVIDDLDKQRNTERARETLFTVLNERYNNRLPTVITLNTPMTAPDPEAPGKLALQNLMGTAMLDRMIEQAWRIIEFDGVSYRSAVQWSE